MSGRPITRVNGTILNVIKKLINACARVVPSSTSQSEDSQGPSSSVCRIKFKGYSYVGVFCIHKPGFLMPGHIMLLQITCHGSSIYVTRHEKPGLCTQNTPIHIKLNIFIIVQAICNLQVA